MTGESWINFKTVFWGDDSSPNFLNPPINPLELDKFIDVTGYIINEDIADILKLNNGEKIHPGGGSIFGEFLLDFAGIIETQAEYQNYLVYLSSDGYSYSEMPEASQDCRLKYGYPFPQLTPFISNLSDMFFGVDNSPGVLGVKGQVYAYGRDLEPTYICDSVSDFFNRLRKLYKNLEIRYVALPLDNETACYPRIVYNGKLVKEFREILSLIIKFEDI